MFSFGRASLVAACLLLLPVGPSLGQQGPSFGVLVFSKTTGYRHESIAPGIAAIRAMGAAHGFAVEATEDSNRFTEASLGVYQVVVFLNTTGKILEPAQQAAFENFIRRGGGFVGIHSASDTEYDWPWYGRLVGAYFDSHPPGIHNATIRVEDRDHPSTRGLSPVWQRIDEWYNFTGNLRGKVHVLATLDETSYAGGTMKSDHPIAWCHDFDGGRSWYTALGHTTASYDEPMFREHLLGGILSTAGRAEARCPIGP